MRTAASEETAPALAEWLTLSRELKDLTARRDAARDAALAALAGRPGVYVTPAGPVRVALRKSCKFDADLVTAELDAARELRRAAHVSPLRLRKLVDTDRAIAALVGPHVRRVDEPFLTTMLEWPGEE